MSFDSRILFLVLFLPLIGCNAPDEQNAADLILENGRVYSFAWDDPGLDGTPAENAPFGPEGWQPDAEALAVRGGLLVYVGDGDGVRAFRGRSTKVVDLKGATVIPGLVDSHVHIAELGESLERVNLVGVDSEEEAVERVAGRAARLAKGEWVIGWGWDEGAWADSYPTHKLLSERVPDNPVYLKGLHGFAVWGNQMALERAGITKATQSPGGGEILKDQRGQPTGLLLNNAGSLLEDAIPKRTLVQLKERILAGLNAMAQGGYVAVHEAGASPEIMEAFEQLGAEGRLPLRVYAMLSGRAVELIEKWIERGPEIDSDDMLVTRSVKAYYDGALGSRGARLLDDYSDQPGHRGVSGSEYGFDQALVARVMKAGFQVGIHAIGDEGNRATLDFFDEVFRLEPQARNHRHRIEHVQVLHPDDIGRLAELDIIASMQPPHAVEDKAWAEDRLGPARVKGAYAWRTLRRTGARLVFNSDLAGSDHDIFYGLHAAITRRDKALEPEGGWYPEESLSPEEAVRAYTSWPAYAAFWEEETGSLTEGRWADMTVMGDDPLRLGATDPGRLSKAKIEMTIVAGRIVYSR